MYKYYLAIHNDGSQKPGINRIIFSESSVEITREYLPESPNGENIIWATEEEINKSLTKN